MDPSISFLGGQQRVTATDGWPFVSPASGNPSLSSPPWSWGGDDPTATNSPWVSGFPTFVHTL